MVRRNDAVARELGVNATGGHKRVAQFILVELSGAVHENDVMRACFWLTTNGCSADRDV